MSKRHSRCNSALALPLVVCLWSIVGCRKVVYRPIGVAECRAVELPPTAVYTSWTGTPAGVVYNATQRTVHDDGRVVEVTVTVTDKNVTRTGHVNVERLRKLDADLAATGVFDLKEGCWDAVTPADQPRYNSWEFVFRHGGKAYTYLGRSRVFHGPPDDVNTPEPLRRARHILDAFNAELGTDGIESVSDGGVDAR